MNSTKLSTLIFLFMTMGLSSCVISKGYKGEQGDLPRVADTLYKKECGGCHWDYHPALLPTRSWMAMMDQLDSHFGDNASLPPKTAAKIRDILILNSAEHANAKLGRKIIEANLGQTPSSISQMEYIKRKHHDLSDDVFARKEIKSRANCTACHQSAKDGVFDDDDVKIPNPTAL